jgi:hypothetical protein
MIAVLSIRHTLAEIADALHGPAAAVETACARHGLTEQQTRDRLAAAGLLDQVLDPDTVLDALTRRPA